MSEPVYDQSQTVVREEMAESLVEVRSVTTLAYDLTSLEPPAQVQLHEVSAFFCFTLFPSIYA